MLKDSPLMVDFMDGRTPRYSTFREIYDILWYIAMHEPHESLINALGNALQRPTIDPFIKDPLLDTEL